MKVVVALCAAGAGVLAVSTATRAEGVSPSARADEAAFAQLDRNGDKRVSKTEAGSDRVLANEFAYIDTDGDGYISLAEFLARDGTVAIAR